MAAVSSILKFLEANNQNCSLDQNIEMSRPKKRKLDHLTWEEKMQRKKLKNRVAAQTSRDRKKAKMDQMEHALQQLFSKNETLTAECEGLKLANQRLSQENADLYNRLQSPCSTCANYQNRSVVRETLNGPTESLLLPKGRVTHSAAILHKIRRLSQRDLLDELDTDTDLNSLEQLTQSLLQDIARDLETASQKTDCQESENVEHSTREVVGQAPTQLEPSRRKLLTKEKSLEHDISEYLLLHHNYAAKPPTSTRKSKPTSTRNKFKPIQPKLNLDTTKTKIKDRTHNLLVDADTPVVMAEDEDVLYGTLDEDTNIVTICIDGGSTCAISEIESIQNEGITDKNVLAVQSQAKQCASPLSYSGSDIGYESLDSPSSVQEDIWDQSISELFPSLF